MAMSDLAFQRVWRLLHIQIPLYFGVLGAVPSLFNAAGLSHFRGLPLK